MDWRQSSQWRLQIKRQGMNVITSINGDAVLNNYEGQYEMEKCGYRKKLGLNISLIQK